MPCSHCKMPGHTIKTCKGSGIIQPKVNPVSQAQEVKVPTPKVDIYENAKPSTHDGYWIYYANSNYRPCYIESPDYYDGKWMLFYPKSVIDEKWDLFKNLCRDGNLHGINAIKVSGAKENPRASNKNDAVLILYLSGTYAEVKESGEYLRQYLGDYGSNYIYFKTNCQTRLGTRATGAEVNHQFRVAVHQKCLIQD
jgi:hypothetical protein